MASEPKDHSFEIREFYYTEISLIHRSAYDYLFDSEDWNLEHAGQDWLHFGCSEKFQVASVIQEGLMRLIFINPIGAHENIQNDFLRHLTSHSADIIAYTANTPSL